MSTILVFFVFIIPNAGQIFPESVYLTDATFGFLMIIFFVGLSIVFDGLDLKL